MSQENFFLDTIIELSKNAYNNNSVPVSAVLIHENSIITASSNDNNSIINHAEINCIKQAALNNFNHFSNSILYVTLEPCLMCLGAITLTKIPQVIYILPCAKWGYSNDFKLLKNGIYFTRLPLIKKINYREKEYQELITAFFKKKRN